MARSSRERRERIVEAATAAVWNCIADLGGEIGWYAVEPGWRLRGVVDRVLRGPGNHGRPDRELRVGEPWVGWRVEAVEGRPQPDPGVRVETCRRPSPSRPSWDCLRSSTPSWLDPGCSGATAQGHNNLRWVKILPVQLADDRHHRPC